MNCKDNDNKTINYKFINIIITIIIINIITIIIIVTLYKILSSPKSWKNMMKKMKEDKIEIDKICISKKVS